MKKPRWFKRRSGENSSESKSEKLKSVRQQTDQKLKQQQVQKEQGDEGNDFPVGKRNG